MERTLVSLLNTGRPPIDAYRVPAFHRKEKLRCKAYYFTLLRLPLLRRLVLRRGGSFVRLSSSSKRRRILVFFPSLELRQLLPVVLLVRQRLRMRNMRRLLLILRVFHRVLFLVLLIRSICALFLLTMMKRRMLSRLMKLMIRFRHWRIRCRNLLRM